MLLVFAPPGAVPVVGGGLRTPPYHGPLKPFPKEQGGPWARHPAVTSPPRLCWELYWVLCRVLSGSMLVFSVRCFSIWGRDAVWFGAL